jgi:DNA-binding NarL/FixJ family response regulator
MRIGNKIKIIITDDSTSSIEALEILLTSDSKFEVLDRCANGAELCRNRNLSIADLLLIDIEMPIMNGIEAAKKINFIHPHIPMIAVTMNVRTIFLKDVVYAGFKGFVYKANIQSDLIPTIEKVLNNKFVFPKDLNI